MKESLSTRVGRVISGSVHKIAEALENAAPEMLMEQAIREVEGVIDEVRSELGTVTARKHLASERLMEENRKHEDLSEKIEFALKEGREELAEAAVARQLDIEAQLPVLESTITQAAEKEKELGAMVTALQGRKREMQDDLRQYRVATQAQQGPTAVGSARPNWEGSAEKAQNAFDRVMEKQTGIQGRNYTDDSKLVELEELARRNRIQERLSAAKAKISSP